MVDEVETDLSKEDTHTLLDIIHKSKDYPTLRPIHNRALKHLERIAAKVAKADAEAAKREAQDKALADAKAAREAQAAADAAAKPAPELPPGVAPPSIGRRPFGLGATGGPTNAA